MTIQETLGYLSLLQIVVSYKRVPRVRELWETEGMRHQDRRGVTIAVLRDRGVTTFIFGHHCKEREGCPKPRILARNI